MSQNRAPQPIPTLEEFLNSINELIITIAIENEVPHEISEQLIQSMIAERMARVIIEEEDKKKISKVETNAFQRIIDEFKQLQSQYPYLIRVINNSIYEPIKTILLKNHKNFFEEVFYRVRNDGNKWNQPIKEFTKKIKKYQSLIKDFFKLYHFFLENELEEIYFSAVAKKYAEQKHDGATDELIFTHAMSTKKFRYLDPNMLIQTLNSILKICEARDSLYASGFEPVILVITNILNKLFIENMHTILGNFYSNSFNRMLLPINLAAADIDYLFATPTHARFYNFYNIYFNNVIFPKISYHFSLKFEHCDLTDADFSAFKMKDDKYIILFRNNVIKNVNFLGGNIQILGNHRITIENTNLTLAQINIQLLSWHTHQDPHTKKNIYGIPEICIINLINTKTGIAIFKNNLDIEFLPHEKAHSIQEINSFVTLIVALICSEKLAKIKSDQPTRVYLAIKSFYDFIKKIQTNSDVSPDKLWTDFRQASKIDLKVEEYNLLETLIKKAVTYTKQPENSLATPVVNVRRETLKLQFFSLPQAEQEKLEALEQKLAPCVKGII